MSESNERAHQIYQALLDGTGDAFELRDVDRFTPFFSLPHSYETLDGRALFETRDALSQMFDGVCAHMDAHSITNLLRVCTVAQFDGPTMIRGCHDTKLIKNTGEVHQTYSALTTLKLVAGQWKISAGQYLEKYKSLPTLSLYKYFEHAETS